MELAEYIENAAINKLEKQQFPKYKGRNVRGKIHI